MMTTDQILEMTAHDAAKFAAHAGHGCTCCIAAYDRQQRREEIERLAGIVMAGDDRRDDGSSESCERLMYLLMRHHATGDRRDRRLAADVLFDIYAAGVPTLSCCCNRYLRLEFEEDKKVGLELLHRPPFFSAGDMIMTMLMLMSDGYVTKNSNAAINTSRVQALFYLKWAAKREKIDQKEFDEDLSKLWKAVAKLLG